MFEKRRALGIYKKMLEELKELKEIMLRTNVYDGFDRGYMIIPNQFVNKKLVSAVRILAAEDGYNFGVYSIKNSDGTYSTLFAINNMSKEMKEQRNSEIASQAEATFKL